MLANAKAGRLCSEVVAGLHRLGNGDVIIKNARLF
jgi:hypothetical protein